MYGSDRSKKKQDEGTMRVALLSYLDGDEVEAQLLELVEGSGNKMISPKGCVPFVKLRSVVSSGVVRLTSVLDATATEECRKGSSIVLNSDLPIIVLLNGTLSANVVRHFVSCGLLEEEARCRFRSRSAWFGIIEGAHIHDVICKLI